jgi:hypothetical protein
MVLIERGKHRRNNALAESVVERIVDGGGQDAEARGDVALDGDVEDRPGTLLIGGNVGDARDGLDPVEEERRPMIELAGIGVGRCRPWSSRLPVLVGNSNSNVLVV